MAETKTRPAKRRLRLPGDPIKPMKYPWLRVTLRILAGLLIALLVLGLGMVVLPMTEKVSDRRLDGAADWMGRIDDNALLSELVIPGTHDSATRNVQLAFFSKCQGLSVIDQLEAGYRYLDIRLEADNGRMKLVHGYCECKTEKMPWSDTLWLDDVLLQCYAFLALHPTETVIFAVKQEHGDATVEEFQTLLDSYVQQAPERWLLTETIPSLGEARGKLVLMRRYEDEARLGAAAGIPLIWAKQEGSEDTTKHIEATDNGSYTLWVQDRFCYGDKDKWAAFLAGQQEPSIGPMDLSIHFLSTKGTLTYGHPFAHARRLNKKLMNLQGQELRGWIVVDFGGAKLAEKIYSENFN